MYNRFPFEPSGSATRVLAPRGTSVAKLPVSNVAMVVVAATVVILLFSGLAAAQIPGVHAANNSKALNVPPPPTTTKNITVGKEPAGLVYDPASNQVFVANEGSSSVSVISGTTVVKTLKVGKTPETVLYDPKTTLLYSVNSGSNNVSVINGSTDKVVGTITGFATFSTFSVYDPTNGAVYLFSSTFSLTTSIMYRLPTASPWTFTSIKLGAYSVDATYDPATTDIVVSNLESGNLSIVNSSTNKVKTVTLTTGFLPAASVYNSANKDVYVVDEGMFTPHTKSGNVTVLGSANTIVKTVSVGGGTPVSIVLDPNNHDVYVVNVTLPSKGSSVNCSVTPITSSNTAKKALKVGDGAFFATYDPNNNEIYVPAGAANDTTIISGTSVLTTLTTKGTPQAAFYDPGTTDMVLALDTPATSAGQLTFLSSPTSGNPAVVGTQILGKDPSGYTYDTMTTDVYVSNFDSKTVTEF
jgi:YVTN family beta-propeller protein